MIINLYFCPVNSVNSSCKHPLRNPRNSQNATSSEGSPAQESAHRPRVCADLKVGSFSEPTGGDHRRRKPASWPSGNMRTSCACCHVGSMWAECVVRRVPAGLRPWSCSSRRQPPARRHWVVGPGPASLPPREPVLPGVALTGARPQLPQAFLLRYG